MNLYYFGSSLQYIQAQYATSNRSTCRTCKEKIEKDAVRLGLILDDDHFNAKYWYHLKCFQLKPRHLEIQQDKIQQKIYNIDKMEEKDFNDIIDHIKSQLYRLKNKKSGKKQSKKSTKKQSKKGNKKKKKQSQSQQQQQQYKSQSSSQQQISQSSSSQQSIKKKKKKKLSKPKKAKVQPYTQQQLKTYQQLVQKYSGMTADSLKQILGKNKQAKNGNKPELVQRCADGKILGAIPTCEACGGGRLRFDRQTGIYTCPGFMEDTDFIRCGKKFQLSQIKRSEWTQ